MKHLKYFIGAIAIVLVGAACTGNGGNKKNSNVTKEETKMNIVELNKADFLKKVYNFEADPMCGSLRQTPCSCRFLCYLVWPVQGSSPSIGRHQ